MFLNSHIGQRDVTDGTSHTIYVGEKVADDEDLGWMSGTRATLRNTAAFSQPQNFTNMRNAGPPKPANDLVVGGFASDHTSCANFLFGDGRTASVSYAIEPKVLEQLGNRADGQLIESGPSRDW
jgi:hypothetical protein